MIKAIYIIINKVNNKYYIGQSVDPNHRFVSHKSRARNGEAGALHNAMRKYGEENFEMQVLEWTENYNEREKYWIKEYNSLYPNGYNLTEGGEEPPHYYGEEHHNSIYSQYIVDCIIDDLLHTKLNHREIAEKYQTTKNLITSINMGVTHRKENLTYPLRVQSPYRLTPKDVEEIKWLLKETKYTVDQIGEYYDVSPAAIKHINAGRNYYVEGTDYPIRKFRGCYQTQPVEAILAKRSTTVIGTQLEM